MICFDNFQMLIPERQLRKDGKPLVLRERAFEVLQALIERPGQVVTKRELCRRAWPERDVDENNLHVEILGLRKLLGKQAIVTAPGRGYQFALNIETDVKAAAPENSVTLIGRDDDLVALGALMAPGVLVTLVGEGGIGKSVLASAFAQRHEAASAGAACVVAMDAVQDGSQLRKALSDALQVPPTARLDSAALWGRALRDRRLLLVFDGCEQGVQGIAEMASVILSECPGISLLATSRELLRVPGERVYRLGPLALESSGDAATAGECDAVVLFRKCRSGHAGRIAGNDDEAAAILAICRLLEGNPLAIKLAAQCAVEPGVETLFRRLDERLDLLQDANADAPPRQRSLRASLAWSYQLLSDPEQRVFRELATLVQPFALAQVLAIKSLSSLDPWDAMEALTRLVDKSLVGIDGADPPNYWLSATALVYAREQRNSFAPKAARTRKPSSKRA